MTTSWDMWNVNTAGTAGDNQSVLARQGREKCKGWDAAEHGLERRGWGVNWVWPEYTQNEDKRRWNEGTGKPALLERLQQNAFHGCFPSEISWLISNSQLSPLKDERPPVSLSSTIILVAQALHPFTLNLEYSLKGLKYPLPCVFLWPCLRVVLIIYV